MSCCGSGDALQSALTHADAEEAAHGQELRERLHKARSERQHADEDQVAHQRPLAAVAVRDQASDDGAKGAEEEREGDRRGDVVRLLAELHREARDGERDAEEVPWRARRCELEAQEPCAAAHSQASIVQASQPLKNHAASRGESMAAVERSAMREAARTAAARTELERVERGAGACGDALLLGGQLEEAVREVLHRGRRGGGVWGWRAWVGASGAHTAPFEDEQGSARYDMDKAREEQATAGG